MATRVLYLIRHAQYQRRKYDRQTLLTVEQANKLDEGLTPLGMEQAQWTARRFSKWSATAIHYSTLPRATQTAEIITAALPSVPLHRSQGLRECIPNVPPTFVDYFKKRFTGDLSLGARQAEKSFTRYFKPARGEDKHELVISHGNLIRYFICRVLQAPVESWINLGSHHCGISQVVIRASGKKELVSYNDVGHLPSHLRTQI